MQETGSLSPWWERVRVRGQKIRHPNLCPLPSRERMLEESLLVKFVLTLIDPPRLPQICPSANASA
jgi:hypothetical protein